MVSLTVTQRYGLLSLLILGCTTAAPTATIVADVQAWPEVAVISTSIHQRSTDTNAERMARGLPLKGPVRRNELAPRLVSAPSQAVSTTNSETFTLQACSSSYSSTNTYIISGTSSTDDLVDTCAEQAAQDGETTFAVSSSGYCYTGVTDYEANEETCTSTDAAVYST